MKKYITFKNEKQKNFAIKKLVNEGWTALRPQAKTEGTRIVFKNEQQAAFALTMLKKNKLNEAGEAKDIAKMQNEIGNAYNALRAALSIAATNDFKESERTLQQFIKKDMAKLNGVISSQKLKGESKKTGRPYCLNKITMSDGFSEIEGITWDRPKGFKWNENDLVAVQGTLKAGWRSGIDINISSIEKIN